MSDWGKWRHYGIAGFIRYRNNDTLTARASQALDSDYLNALEARLRAAAQRAKLADKMAGFLHDAHGRSSDWQQWCEQLFENADNFAAWQDDYDALARAEALRKESS